MTFSGKFFSFKSAWIFARAAFQLSRKEFPCIFFGWFFVSFLSKSEDKILRRAQWTQQSGTRAFQRKKDKGECFSTKLRSTCKNSGTFEAKKMLPEKVTCVRLAPTWACTEPNWKKVINVDNNSHFLCKYKVPVFTFDLITHVFKPLRVLRASAV